MKTKLTKICELANLALKLMPGTVRPVKCCGCSTYYIECRGLKHSVLGCDAKEQLHLAFLVGQLAVNLSNRREVSS